MACTIGIWVTGGLSAALFGSLLGAALVYDGSASGAFAGALAFAGLRLWSE